PEEMAGWEIIRLPVGVDDPHAPQLDVRTAGVQPNGLEAPFTPTDTHRVVVLAEERDLLAAELDPGSGAGHWARHRCGRTAARRLAEHPDDGFPAEARA